MTLLNICKVSTTDDCDRVLKDVKSREFEEEESQHTSKDVVLIVLVRLRPNFDET
jgi:hypothetical protein